MWRGDGAAFNVPPWVEVVWGLGGNRIFGIKKRSKVTQEVVPARIFGSARWRLFSHCPESKKAQRSQKGACSLPHLCFYGPA